MNTAAIIARCTPHVFGQLTGSENPTAIQLLLPILSDLANTTTQLQLAQYPEKKTDFYVVKYSFPYAYLRLCAVAARFSLGNQVVRWRNFGAEFPNPETTMSEKLYETVEVIVSVLQYRKLLHADRIGQGLAMIEHMAAELGLKLEEEVLDYLSVCETANDRYQV